MRVLLLVVTLGLLVSTAPADARGRSKTKKRVAIATSVEKRQVVEKKKPKSRGQSIGAPWSGKLDRSTKFRAPERTHLRRPHRAFGTRTTVDHTRRAIMETLVSFPKAHTFAIGDFSAPRGGRISEHNSHQSGRDVDLGLFYKKKPAGYPASFVEADEDTLHKAAMWSLIANLASTRDDDGGIHIMFLDFDLQGVIYDWAKENGVSEGRLNRIFQYPHGRGASAGLVRHEPNHGNHLHVRFRCAAADVACR
ncbi:MAG: penicillin-insensitive murein endopeptidase [Myxococcota bacterium]|nr:penicillin-insensitive murein endopeptidase [Deltaproteobacteria bacterium]MDQ3333881.1 penicillin-insensitive murein endopeptidase [Myxococcota bacterium]